MADADSDKPTVHNRIRPLRREAGVSRSEMAKEIGINENTLSVIERGEREPKVRVAWRIADYFDLPLEAVFAEEPMPTLADFLRRQYRCTGHRRSEAHTGEEDRP